MTAIVAAAGLLGLVVGSFLNVVIWRLPRGQSLVFPASHCPACGQPIRAWDNIPVLGWVLLRGRCRDCRASISPRYPLVEAGTAALFAIVTAHLGLDWRLPAYLYLCAVGVALAVIDIDHHRLPNALVLPSYPIVAGLLLLAVIAGGAWGDGLRAAAGAVALFGFYFILVLVYPAGMGWGDVKLAGVLGMALGFLGWGPLVVGGFLGFALGGFFGIALIAVRRAGRRSAIPFGPFMLAGALAALLWGNDLAALYLSTLPT